MYEGPRVTTALVLVKRAGVRFRGAPRVFRDQMRKRGFMSVPTVAVVSGYLSWAEWGLLFCSQ